MNTIKQLKTIVALLVSTFFLISSSHSIDGDALYEQYKTKEANAQKEFLYSLPEDELLALANMALINDESEEIARSFLYVLYARYWKVNPPKSESILPFFENTDRTVSEIWASYLFSNIGPFIQKWNREDVLRLIRDAAEKIHDPELQDIKKDFYIRGMSTVASPTILSASQSDGSLDSDDLDFIERLNGIIAPVILETIDILHTMKVDTPRQGGMYRGLINSLIKFQDFFAKNPSFQSLMPEVYASLQDLLSDLKQELDKKKSFESVYATLGLLIHYKNRFPNLTIEYLESYVNEISEDERFTSETEQFSTIRSFQSKVKRLKGKE